MDRRKLTPTTGTPPAMPTPLPPLAAHAQATTPRATDSADPGAIEYASWIALIPQRDA